MIDVSRLLKSSAIPPASKPDLFELLPALESGANHLGIDLASLGHVGCHPDQACPLVLLERRDGDLKRAAGVSELVVASAEVGHRMQRPDREPLLPGRASSAVHRYGCVRQAEKLSAFPGRRRDTKVVVRGPHRAGEVAQAER